jgi:hypothetical protein
VADGVGSVVSVGVAEGIALAELAGEGDGKATWRDAATTYTRIPIPTTSPISVSTGATLLLTSVL